MFRKKQKSLGNCVECGKPIKDRSLEGNAQTCTQRCAGFLSWRNRCA